MNSGLPAHPAPSAAAATVRVLAIADTDSYLKWSAATLDALPRSWESSQLLIRNPLMPSEAQIQAASSRPVEVLSRAELLRRIRLECPDVVLLACTGPVVGALTAHRVFWSRHRPVLVTGLPGISVPATRRAVMARAACDLFLLHSKREVAEFSMIAREVPTLAITGKFADVSERQSLRLRFGLARLPFLPVGTPENLNDANQRWNAVFAAQAKVPADRAEREEILLALTDAGAAVVKLRAYAEEQQTHRETWSYPQVWHDLVAQGRAPAGAVAFVGGSMEDALRTARGFATVSSTAALEAIAMARPTLIISDFGVTAEMINLVFEDSGCLGTLDDLRSGRFFHPKPHWLEANYFHPTDDNDWLEQLSDLLTLRTAGQLPSRPRLSVPLRNRARFSLRLIIPPALWPHHARRSHRAIGRSQRARLDDPAHPPESACDAR